MRWMQLANYRSIIWFSCVRLNEFSNSDSTALFLHLLFFVVRFPHLSNMAVTSLLCNLFCSDDFRLPDDLGIWLVRPRGSFVPQANSDHHIVHYHRTQVQVLLISDLEVRTTQYNTQYFKYSLLFSQQKEDMTWNIHMKTADTSECSWSRSL
jgi:hypothetical protein